MFFLYKFVHTGSLTNKFYPISFVPMGGLKMIFHVSFVHMGSLKKAFCFTIRVHAYSKKAYQQKSSS